MPAILSLVFGIFATFLLLLYQYTFGEAIGLWAIGTGIAGVVLGMYGYLKHMFREIAVAGTLISTLVLLVFFTIMGK